MWEIAAILNCPLTPAGNMRRPSEALLQQWIETAWMVISPESNDKNGAENDALWESGQEENSFPVIRVLAATSELSDVFLIFYYKNMLII